MAATHNVDLLIVGAGCAGLSLARTLAQSKVRLRTLLIDPRVDYSDDRTWCFWGRDNSLYSHLATRAWDKWRFSTPTDSVTQAANNSVRYHCLRSIDFYQDAIDTIGASKNIELVGGVKALSIEQRALLAEADTSMGTVRARFVVDTRPPGPKALNDSLMQQVFVGAEVVTDRDVFRPCTVGLMDAMTADNLGFRFTYLLPFGERHALVEETRFTDKSVTNDDLWIGLNGTLGALDASLEVVRSESGRLPMGVTPRPNHPHIVTAGIGGGAIRASTGYAFSRIQNWAHSCAARLAAGLPPNGHAPDPAWRAAMDRLFLRVLRAQPELGPRLFMAMGKKLSAESFVRFLSDNCRPRDFARVVDALPKSPFIKQLVRETVSV